MISKKSKTTQYVLTPYGYRVALFITRIHSRLFRAGFASLDEHFNIQIPHPLRCAMDKVDTEIDKMFEKSNKKLAA